MSNALNDQEQAIYTATPVPVDLTEIIATYNALLAGDNLPERVAVHTVDLRALLDAAATTLSVSYSTLGHAV